jgi:hypothetical protein
MRKSLHRFGLGASGLLPEAATRFGAALRRGPRARNRKQELLSIGKPVSTFPGNALVRLCCIFSIARVETAVG